MEEATESEEPLCGRIVIAADDRESGSALVERLRTLEEIRLEVRRLAVGDYAIGDHCVLERKTWRDLAMSVVDGRLFRQVGRLRRGPCPSALLLEGEPDEDLEDVGVRREALEGALVSVSLVWGVPVLRVRDAVEGARVLLYAGRQFLRSGRGAPAVSGGRRGGPGRIRLRLLRALPGIGDKRARCLLERFGSVRAIVNADADELASVRGIGGGIAKGIVRVVG